MGPRLAAISDDLSSDFGDAARLAAELGLSGLAVRQSTVGTSVNWTGAPSPPFGARPTGTGSKYRRFRRRWVGVCPWMTIPHRRWRCWTG